MRLPMVAMVLLLGACAENRETLFVRQVQVPQDDCTISDDAEGLFRTGGVLDVAFQGEYVLTPLLENQMIARQSRESLRVESNGVQVDGAIVRLYETSDPELPPEETAPVLEFFSYASSYIAPEGNSPTLFTAIPPEYTRSAEVYERLCGFGIGQSPAGYDPRTDLVLVGATIQGITNGGLAVESPEFLFPVTLCCGCLASCTSDADEPEIAGADCCGTDEVTDAPCFRGQDQYVDCRLYRGSSDDLLDILARCGGPAVGGCSSGG
jgi:hypothetical protein